MILRDSQYFIAESGYSRNLLILSIKKICGFSLI